MSLRFLRFLAVLACLTTTLCAFEPRSLKDCRLAFLLGMADIMKTQDGWEVLPEDGRAELYRDVARAYAVDLGAAPEELKDDRWRAKVLKSIKDSRALSNTESMATIGELFGVDSFKNGRLDLPLAYLAGAYASHGTPSGFRMVDKRQGLYVVLLIHTVSRLQIESVHRPGYPGNFVITLSGGGKGEFEDFFTEMRNVREGLLLKK